MLADIYHIYAFVQSRKYRHVPTRTENKRVIWNNPHIDMRISVTLIHWHWTCQEEEHTVLGDKKDVYCVSVWKKHNSKPSCTFTQRHKGKILIKKKRYSQWHKGADWLATVVLCLCTVDREKERVLPCLCHKCTMAVLFPHLAVFYVCTVYVCVRQKGLFLFHPCAGLHVNVGIDLTCLKRFT